jgi:hypothetical protein
MTNTKLLLSVAAASVLALNGCMDINRTDTATFTTTSYTDTNGTDTGTDTGADTGYCTVDNTISGFITTDLLLTQDTCIDGQLQVKSGASITANNITIAGVVGSKAWIEVLPGGKIYANGVTFTSEEEASGGTGAPGQWGGVTLIGNDNTDEDGTAVNTQIDGGYEVDGTLANGSTTVVGDMTDSSGNLTNCTINNTGIAVQQDKEINGLSFVGVGSGTVISGITVNRSGDDAIEIWGGHVALTDVTIVGAGDDGFDNDDGWAGSVDGLSVSGVTNSGLELSGNTHATYTNVTIDMTGSLATSDAGGAIYLKKTAIGGYFTDVVITDNQANTYGTIVTDAADLANLEGMNITITGSNTAGIVTEGPHYDATVATTAEVQTALGL